MIHSVFLVLGADTIGISTALKRYVLMNGEGEPCDYLKVLNWSTFPDGKRCVYSYCVNDAKTGDFCSVMENEFSVIPKETGEISTEEEVPHFFSVLYSQTVTLAKPSVDNTLHLHLLLPLYEKDLWIEAKLIMDSINKISQSYSVDIIGLSDDMFHLLTDENGQMSFSKLTELKSNVSLVCNEIKNYKGKCKHHFIMLQNKTSDGVSLDLDKNSLVVLLGEFALACTGNYYSVFSPASESNSNDVDGIGLSVLHFDKYYFINYLLRKAYLKVLARENVTQKDVDVNKVSHIAQKSLEENVNIYTKFYSETVEPLLKGGKSKDDIIVSITPLLDDRLKKISKEIQTFISDENLSLPEKQAVLAQILGEDDQMLKGNLFYLQQLTIDDYHRDVLQLYIDENNKAIERTVDDKGNTVIHPAVLDCPQKDDGYIYLPLDELKTLRVKIKESSNYIREKSKELENLDKLLQKTELSKIRLTDNGFTYGDVTYKLLKVEELTLKEDYEPNAICKKTVDMREKFPPVKDQGALGTCAVFSIVSIYEHILKNTDRFEDLSERFVYYNVLNDSGQIDDTGASLYSVVDSMSTHGVCSESLCRYDIEQYQAKPSEGAYTNANIHKIKCAKNVKISHKDITSALSEGFPIAISLKIYNSFGENRKGFVFKPTEKEIEEGLFGNHAMVICGYSEEEKVYIVRNSWGEGFGDKGYCYIPFSYIEDPTLTNNACIVTAINEGENVKGIGTPTVVAFNKTDIDIRYSILRILVDEEKLFLKEIKRSYDTLRFDYEQLIQVLSNNGNRNRITTLSHNLLEKSITTDRTQYEKFVNSGIPKELNELKTEGIWIAVMVALVPVISTTAWIICNEFVDNWLNNKWMWVISAFFAIGLVLLVLYIPYKMHHYRVKREELKEEAQIMNVAILKKKKDLDVLYLRLFVAGMVIDGLVKLHKNLNEKYLTMKSYVGNLSIWYKEECNKISRMEIISKVPLISVLNNDILDSYFKEKGEELTRDVRLYKYIDEYQLSEVGISEYKSHIKSVLIKALQKPLYNVKLYDKLVVEKRGEKLQEMESKINSFLQTSCTNLHENKMMAKLIFLSANDDKDLCQIQSDCHASFITPPGFESCQAWHKITLLQRSCYKLEDLVI